MGPTFLVHLPTPLSTEDTENIHTWLTEHTHIYGHQGIEWEFHFDVKDTCLCSISIVPFEAEYMGDGTASDVYMEEDERLAYEKGLGFCPNASLQFDNYCGGDYVGHKLLSQFASLLARRHNGLVDVGESFYSRGAGDKEIKPEIIKSGKLYVVDRLGYRYRKFLADADFMDEWIQHPDFRLRD